MKLSNFDLQYLEQYKKLTESVKLIEDGSEYVCPNCGSVHVYKGRFFMVPSKNKEIDEDIISKTSDAWFCKDCGFVWTDDYTHTEYDFSSTKNKFTK